MFFPDPAPSPKAQEECRKFLEKGCLLSTNRKQLLLMSSAMSFNVLKVFFCDTRTLIWWQLKLHQAIAINFKNDFTLFETTLHEIKLERLVIIPFLCILFLCVNFKGNSESYLTGT